MVFREVIQTVKLNAGLSFKNVGINHKAAPPETPFVLQALSNCAKKRDIVVGFLS